jgi:hypothetical protein
MVSFLPVDSAEAIVLGPTVDGTIFDFGYVNTVESVQAAIDFSRGILEFDMSGISDPVGNSFLRLYHNASLGPFPFQVDVFSYSGNGIMTADDYSSGSFSAWFSYNNEAVFDVDLTATVQDAVSNAYSFLGINLRMPPPYPEDAFPYISFGSLEYPKAGPKPAELHITILSEETNTVPEPATMVLLGSGLIGGAFIRRKRA